MEDLREGLTKVDTKVVTAEIYERAFRYYCRMMLKKIVFILLIAVVGIVSIVENAVHPSTLCTAMNLICILLLLTQALTLPDGTVCDRNGNVFDLNSGTFVEYK